MACPFLTCPPFLCVGFSLHLSPWGVSSFHQKTYNEKPKYGLRIKVRLFPLRGTGWVSFWVLIFLHWTSFLAPTFWLVLLWAGSPSNGCSRITVESLKSEPWKYSGTGVHPGAVWSTGWCLKGGSHCSWWVLRQGVQYYLAQFLAFCRLSANSSGHSAAYSVSPRSHRAVRLCPLGQRERKGRGPPLPPCQESGSTPVLYQQVGRQHTLCVRTASAYPALGHAPVSCLLGAGVEPCLTCVTYSGEVGLGPTWDA